MAKTNFSKVEQLIAEGLMKITVDNLLKLADLAATIGASSDRNIFEENRFTGQLKHFLFPDPRRLIITTLRHDISWLYKNDKKFYRKLGIKRERVLNLLADPDKITDKQFEVIKKIKKKVDHYRGKMESDLPEDYLEELVKKERLRHINKRYNVSEKWLPLY